MEKWLNKTERKIGKYAVPYLLVVISALTLAVYLINLLMPSANLISLLSLNMAGVLRGQVWRLVTFVIIPSTNSIFWLLIELYFYCFIGMALEREWGSFKLNVFYLFGMIGTIIAAMFTGYGFANYLNLSLFFAFAILWPDEEVLLFFILPVKMKWLALIDAVLFGFRLLFGPLGEKIAIVMSLINVAIFFGPDFIVTVKKQAKYHKTRSNFKRQMKK